MKNISKIFGAALILLATVGAFASSKQTYSPVFYKDANNVCLSAFALTCDEIGIENCVEELYLTSTGTPLGFASQVFATKTAAGICDDPYERVQ